jgi:hypothetical protein
MHGDQPELGFELWKEGDLLINPEFMVVSTLKLYFCDRVGS